MQGAKTFWKSLLWGESLIALAWCGGCSTVSSIDVTNAHLKERKGAYLNYSVAKSMFTITISAATAAQQATDSTGSAKAALASTSPPTSSTAAAPEAPPLPGAMPPGGGQAAQASPTPGDASGPSKTVAAKDAVSSSPGGDVDTSECGVLAARYATAQAMVGSAIAQFGSLQRRLTQYATNAPADQDTPKKLASAVDDYLNFVADDGAYKPLVLQAGGPEGIFDQISKTCQPRLKVDFQQKIVPDNQRTFALRARTNPFYTDTLSFGVDTSGFLTNGAPVSTSNIPAIGEEIAKDAGMMVMPQPSKLAAAAAGGPLPAFPGMEGARPGPARPTCRLDPGNLKDSVARFAACDASIPWERSIALKLAGLIALNLPAPAALANLPATTLPRTLIVSLEDFAPEGPVATNGAMGRPAAELLNSFGLMLTLKCSGRKDSDPEAQVPESAPSSQAAAFVYDGVVVSAPQACQAKAVQTRGVQNLLVAETYFWAQDSRRLTILPTSRGFLVPRSVTYSFAGGQATAVSDSRPSEALALVSFPGQIIGSFVGGITVGATNRSTNATAKTAELKAEADWKSAQAALLQANASLQAAQSAATTPTGTPSP